MSITPMHSARTFPSDERSVPQARWFVRRELEAWGAPDVVDTAALVTSELVTNAVLHAGTTVRVAVRLDDFRLRVEVQDLHPGRALPVGPARPPDDSEHGRGLLITAAVATSWGVDYTDTTKRVWLEIAREAGPATVRAPVEGDQDAEVRVGVVELSASGLVRGWNDDATRLLGWLPDEVVGESWEKLVEPGRAGTPAGWNGEVAVRAKAGGSVELFSTQHPLGGRDGSVLLLVGTAQRALLERVPAPPEAKRPEDPVGLRDSSLAQLGIDDFLELAVERCRERVGADATYLLSVHDFDADLEVTAVSGLDAVLRGTRIDRNEPGALNPTSPLLPLVETDLADGAVPLLAGTRLRSLVVVPAVVDGRVVGTLGAASEHPGGFDGAQVALLQRVAVSLAGPIDRARLRTAEVERRRWLGLLDEAGVLLAGSLDQRMTMAMTGQIVVPQLATWCAIHLHDERDHPVLQQVWHEDERLVGPLREALERVELAGVRESTDPALAGPVLGIPLTARGREIGVLTLGRPGGQPLAGEILHVAESLARRAAMAIDNARAHGELQAVGEALQRSLLPPSMPSPPGLEVGVVYEAAGEGRTAGGDFYDLFPVGGGRWWWVVGDVCGTGAEAAAVTGLARHTIRALALAGFPVAATLERLNDAILDEGERARFLTLVCGVIEPVSNGRAQMVLVVAGHPPPFLVSQGEVRQVGRPQSLLGVEQRVSYAEDHLELERGDLLVAVTDGVLERREGLLMLGEEGLEAELSEAADLPPQAVAERVRRLVLDFVESPQLDDMAILAIRVPAPDSAG